MEDTQGPCVAALSWHRADLFQGSGLTYVLRNKGNTVSLQSAAAAAASLQPCPTLCDPHRQQPTRLPVPGILQARTLEWVAMSFSNACKGKVKVKALSRVRCILIFSLTKEIILSIIMLNVNCFDTIYN